MERDKQLSKESIAFLKSEDPNFSMFTASNATYPLIEWICKMERFAQQHSSHLQSIIEEKEREIQEQIVYGDEKQARIRFLEKEIEDYKKIEAALQMECKVLQSRLSSNEAVTDMNAMKEKFKIKYFVESPIFENEKDMIDVFDWFIPYLSKQTDKSDAVDFGIRTFRNVQMCAKLELIFKPKYENDVFTWHQIKDAIMKDDQEYLKSK